MKKLLLFTLVSAAGLLIINSAVAQSKAQIHIRKNQNGVTSEETREIPLTDGQNIQDILLEMGVLDEFGQLKEGQELEITIDKSGGEDYQNLQFYMFPDPQSPPSLPEFAPMPPMESRPFLGVMLKNQEEGNSTGVNITEVVEGSAAEKAGLESGDVIVAIDGNEMHSTGEVIEYVQSKEPGEKVNLKILRDGKKKSIKAELGEKDMEPRMYMFEGPPNGEYRQGMAAPNYNFRFDGDSITIFCPPQPNCICPNDSMKICQPFSWNGEGMAIQETAFLGVTPVEEAEPNGQGVRINVEEETSAEKMGLMSGDIITEFNGVKVTTFDALADEIGKTTPGAVVNIKVLREGKEKELSGEIGKRSMSGFDDFRIFHDYKGMDEGGNYFYDYEFDMDAEDVQDHMEEMLQELDRQQEMLDQERDRVESELDRLRAESETITITMRIDEITQADMEMVNRNASPKLESANNLPIDEISFYPNPNDGVLNLKFVTPEKKPIKVVLYNSDGGIVYLEERSSFDGNYNKTIDISDEPVGTYFLQILQNGKSYRKKIVKGS